MAGETAGLGLAEGVKERMGGEIDNLVLFFNSENGDLVRLRLSEMQTGLIKAALMFLTTKLLGSKWAAVAPTRTVAANEKFTRLARSSS